MNYQNTVEFLPDAAIGEYEIRLVPDTYLRVTTVSDEEVLIHCDEFDNLWTR